MSAAPPSSILQLRSSAGLYGADRMVLALNGELRGAAAQSRLLSIQNYLLDSQPLHAAAVAAGQDAVLLPCSARIDTRTVAALGAQIDARRADVLHVHDYKSAFYAWLATRRRPPRLVATLHGHVEATSALRLYNTLETALLRRFDALVVVAEAQVERLLRAGVPRTRIHQVDNGIDVTETEPAPCPILRSELGLPASGPVFGAVARLSPEKNLPLLLQAFAAIAPLEPRASLMLVGDGPQRASLQSQAEQLGLASRIRFAGQRSDMARLYALLDCLVLPSLSEGMPLVVLEAMSRGIPVVASAVGDVPRLLAHAAHGHLVRPGDCAGLQAAMQASLAGAGQRDERARSYIRQHHSSAAMAGHYLALYQSLLDKGHGRKTA